MLPTYYFDVICCPKCRSDLEQQSENNLTCLQCGSNYKVINDIPTLIDEPENRVSQVIKAFYDSAWQREQTGLLKAQVIHEDISVLGQKYEDVNEEKFIDIFQEGGKVFLDAGCGAKPRVTFGATFSYHVCVDFSLVGLMESKELLGERAICVLGSLLNIPIKDKACDCVLASHCIYHVDKDLQQTALSELSRVLSPQGQAVIFYANPDSLEHRILRKIITLIVQAKGKGRDKLYENNFYYYAHPIDSMLKMMEQPFSNFIITVKPLRLFTKLISGKLFQVPLLNILFYHILTLIEHYPLRNHGLYFNSYLTYIAKSNN